eukprot:12899551-Prorocentrum_lima.AAC.1
MPRLDRGTAVQGSSLAELSLELGRGQSSAEPCVMPTWVRQRRGSANSPSGLAQMTQATTAQRTT